jgi:hypothetical protein
LFQILWSLKFTTLIHLNYRTLNYIWSNHMLQYLESKIWSLETRVPKCRDGTGHDSLKLALVIAHASALLYLLYIWPLYVLWRYVQLVNIFYS